MAVHGRARVDTLVHAAGSAGTRAGLIDLTREWFFRKGQNIAFPHTGGAVGLHGCMHALAAAPRA